MHAAATPAMRQSGSRAHMCIKMHNSTKLQVGLASVSVKALIGQLWNSRHPESLEVRRTVLMQCTAVQYGKPEAQPVLGLCSTESSFHQGNRYVTDL